MKKDKICKLLFIVNFIIFLFISLFVFNYNKNLVDGFVNMSLVAKILFIINILGFILILFNFKKIGNNYILQLICFLFNLLIMLGVLLLSFKVINKFELFKYYYGFILIGFVFVNSISLINLYKD